MSATYQYQKTPKTTQTKKPKQNLTNQPTKTQNQNHHHHQQQKNKKQKKDFTLRIPQLRTFCIIDVHDIC